MPELDMNCDLGESFGSYLLGNDVAVLPQITSANIACGFHAGDPATIKATVARAAALNVAIGAHPGLPDLQGFGRRRMQITPEESYDMVLYQVGALKGFTTAAGVRLHHVKAHGALYNMAATDRSLADAICQAVKDCDPDLILYGLAGSELISAAQTLGLTVAQEVFADRTYQPDGTLTSRQQPGAMITDADAAVAQVLSIVCDGFARSVQGSRVPVEADTLCIHGDQPGAATFAQAIRTALVREGICIRAPVNGSVSLA